MSAKKFMMADGTYCHILADKVVFGLPSELTGTPHMSHKNRNRFTVLAITGLLILAVAFSLLYFTDRMVQGLWIFVLMIAALGIYRLWLFRDASDTPCIERKYISSTKLIKRSMGYTTWVIFFATEKGEKLRRFIQVYDSKEFEEKAEKLLREENLI
ncbi:MAG: hypothetical protein AB1458_03335 [Bacteroidota bacterium]